jgi:cell division protein FtsW
LRKEGRFLKILSQTYRSHPDYILLFIVAALLSIGLLMVFSASPTMAMRIGDSFYYLKRHLAALLVGSLALYAGLKMDYGVLKNWATYIIAITLFLLVIVFIPGAGIGLGGARRWIYFGLFTFQPAELAKVALIIFLAKELSSKPLSRSIWPSLAATLITFLLILKEPDLGTAMIIAMIAFAIFYLAGTPIKHFIAVIIVSLSGLLFISLTSAYRLKRLLAYLNPWSDPRGGGFHIIQSLIAVGSGGLFGLGLGASKQKFFYLPQNYTDFIFAIFCEEMGLIGALGIILLFFLFIGRGIRIVRSAPDAFSMLLSGGIVSWIGLQSILNMSVVLGILPTTGIPLPFISYGGTSMIATLFSVGILLNISQFGLMQQVSGSGGEKE